MCLQIPSSVRKRKPNRVGKKNNQKKNLLDHFYPQSPLYLKVGTKFSKILKDDSVLFHSKGSYYLKPLPLIISSLHPSSCLYSFSLRRSISLHTNSSGCREWELRSESFSVGLSVVYQKLQT